VTSIVGKTWKAMVVSGQWFSNINLVTDILQNIFLKQHKYSFNLLKDSNEQINQKDVGHQQVAGHNGGDNPSSGFAGWESNDGSILCRDVLTTWGC